MNNLNKKISHIYARQILDSRGNPTIETRVTADDAGETGIFLAIKGASTGEHEAVELRDNEVAYHGKGVLDAVRNVNDEIAKLLKDDYV